MLKGITKITLIYHRPKPTLSRTFTSREVKEVRPTVGIHNADLQICVGIFYFVVTFMFSRLHTTKKNSWKDVNQQKNNQTLSISEPSLFRNLHPL